MPSLHLIRQSFGGDLTRKDLIGCAEMGLYCEGAFERKGIAQEPEWCLNREIAMRKMHSDDRVEYVPADSKVAAKPIPSEHNTLRMV